MRLLGPGRRFLVLGDPARWSSVAQESLLADDRARLRLRTDFQRLIYVSSGRVRRVESSPALAVEQSFK